MSRCSSIRRQSTCHQRLPGQQSCSILLLFLLIGNTLSGASASRHVKIEQAAKAEVVTGRVGADPHMQAAVPSSADQLRILACVQLKNELPYLVEWVEFHHMMGFTHMVIYDDFSSDNVTMLEALYRQHGRTYLTVVPPFGASEDKFTHRAKTAEHCFLNYHYMADWMINIDLDEFVWSPSYPTLQQYFMNEVPAANHILQVGATRFGWSGQRDRFTYSLHEVGLVSIIIYPLHGASLCRIYSID